ncbi:MAG: hypothetical protein RI897_2634 [Verrucomicrobiota bacterium]
MGEEILMVVLRGEEFLQRGDLGNDGLLELLLSRLQGGFRLFLLGCVVEEDDGPVLSAVIGALGVEGSRVMDFPEDFQDLAVGDDFRVVGDLNDLGVAGGAITDLFISGIRGMSTGVARDDGFDSIESFEGGFKAPEASSSQGGDGFGGGIRGGRVLSVHGSASQ